MYHRPTAMPDDELPDPPPPADLRKKAEWALAIWMLLLVFLPAALYYAGGIASLTILILPPFALGTLAVFVYRMWGRKFLRARHISGIRERRLLNEAALRNRNTERD